MEAMATRADERPRGLLVGWVCEGQMNLFGDDEENGVAPQNQIPLIEAGENEDWPF